MKKLLIGLIMMMGASMLVSACGIKQDLYIEPRNSQEPQDTQSNQDN